MTPLAIVQARLGSKRLPGKMLLPFGGKPLVYWAWKAACDALGPANVVCALPATSDNDPLAEVLDDLDAEVFRWDGPESDVLGRFHACAHSYRWHAGTIICRITPDDPFKMPALIREVANGRRHPVEMSCEAFTLEMLDEAHNRVAGGAREHLTHALFDTPPPPPPPGIWTVDTRAEYEAALRQLVDGKVAVAVA